MQKLQSPKSGYVQETHKKEAFVQLFEVEIKTIVEWFVHCWNKADGKSIKSPAILVFMIMIHAIIYIKTNGLLMGINGMI
ncbi:hypothetical protein [Priestia megaterium]|uniref:hypothetical protein n=1 Tax=Priestia megaterium TaxID=1404 RepID=UPI003CF4659E